MIKATIEGDNPALYNAVVAMFCIIETCEKPKQFCNKLDRIFLTEMITTWGAFLKRIYKCVVIKNVFEQVDCHKST